MSLCLLACAHERLFSLAVRRAWLDVFISGGCAEAVMLTDSDCEIEHTVSALTQHFLCGKGSLQTELSSPGTAQPQAFYFGWHPLAPPPPSQLFSLRLFLQPRKSESLETCVWTDGLRPNRSPQLYGNQFPAMKMVAFFSGQGPQLPSSSSRQRVVWTPVESTAKISVALRKGSVTGCWG